MSFGVAILFGVLIVISAVSYYAGACRGIDDGWEMANDSAREALDKMEKYVGTDEWSKGYVSAIQDIRDNL